MNGFQTLVAFCDVNGTAVHSQFLVGVNAIICREKGKHAASDNDLRVGMDGVVGTVHRDVRRAGNGQGSRRLQALGAGCGFVLISLVPAAEAAGSAPSGGIGRRGGRGALGSRGGDDHGSAADCQIGCGADTVPDRGQIERSTADLNPPLSVFFCFRRADGIPAGGDIDRTVADFYGILATQTVIFGIDGQRASGDLQIIRSGNAVSPIAYNEQGTLPAEFQVILGIDGAVRIGNALLLFFIGDDIIGISVREQVDGIFDGAENDLLGGTDHINRRTVSTGNADAVQVQLDLFLIGGIYTQLSVAQSAGQ
ncbi:unknown [Clostridium sp. CAG:448]|nr:unknown [Clostridium sp. CAG:448]